MIISEHLRSQVSATFSPLGSTQATFPPAGELAKFLRQRASLSEEKSKYITPAIASFFGTAAVDIWQRSIHSFLVSASLTNASPIWASISGYYSSHYSIRGMAHLLGYFYLYTRKRIARLEAGSRGGYKISIERKPKGVGGGGEHQLYWALVKRDLTFVTDPLFTENRQDMDESDSGHRNHANYIDHLGKCPVFRPLSKDDIHGRVDRISKIAFDDTPIPRRSSFPDVEFVQLVAYHRIVRFRRIMDEVVGSDNNFWAVHRDPSFAREYLNFQATNVGGLTNLG